MGNWQGSRNVMQSVHAYQRNIDGPEAVSVRSARQADKFLLTIAFIRSSRHLDSAPSRIKHGKRVVVALYEEKKITAIEMAWLPTCILGISVAQIQQPVLT